MYSHPQPGPGTCCLCLPTFMSTAFRTRSIPSSLSCSRRHSCSHTLHPILHTRRGSHYDFPCRCSILSSASDACLLTHGRDQARPLQPYTESCGKKSILELCRGSSALRHLRVLCTYASRESRDCCSQIYLRFSGSLCSICPGNGTDNRFFLKTKSSQILIGKLQKHG